MKTVKYIAFALLALLSAGTVCQAASPTTTLLKTRASYNAAVKTGIWQSNFAKAKKYATDNGLPFIAVWSNGDACGHCVMFEESVNSSYFKKWMASSGMVFYFTYYGDNGNGTTSKSGKNADDGSVGSKIFHWCRNDKNTSYPFVRIYWPKGKVDIATVGDTVDGKKNNTTGGKKAAAYFAGKLKNFKPPTPPPPTPDVPKYTGGIFAVGDTETDRLEAVVDVTTSVDVSLMRSNSVASTISTNTVQVTYPDNAAEPVSTTVYWAEDEAETNVTVSIPAALGVNKKIELVLLDAAGKLVATSHITMVDAPANSPSNPLWIGERTTSTLEWGEWTMDLDIATNKVNAYNAGKGNSTSGKGKPLLGAAASEKDRAYTLVMLAGCLWCPDCKNTDEYLIMQDKFKTWATENKVALVTLDLPYGDDTAVAPTLLTDKAAWGYSGAAYLSRKMIDKDKAADVLARNFEIAQKLRLPNWTNPTRPPVPSFFILRNDGTVAGRIQYFGGVESPTNTANLDAHIRRLDELLLQVDLPEEEANDNAVWTTESIGSRTNVTGKTISFSDSADVYRLDPVQTKNKRMSFMLVGDDGVALQLKVIAGGETIAQTKGTGPLELGAEIKGTNYCVSVGYETREYVAKKPKPVDPRFSVTNQESTLCHYKLSTDFVVQPTELANDNHIVIEDGVNEVTVALVSNQLYRITNLDTDNAYNLAALMPTNGPGATDAIYLARKTGDARLVLTAAETYIQKWNPGRVGFAVAGVSVMESAVTYILQLVREGGVSGEATLQLSFNAEKSSKYDNLIALPDDFDVPRVWPEGDSDPKTMMVIIVENTFADGDQSIYLDAAAGGDAALGIGQFRMTIRDNDKRVPGKIAITGTQPSMAKSMTAFARAGSDLKIEMSRVDGTTGKQEVMLAASKGTLDETEFIWSNRVPVAEEARLTLPDTTGKVKVTMTPKKGSAVDGNRRILTVEVLDGDVPGFTSNSIYVVATRYINIDETAIKLDDKATASTTVKKYSGALPPGVSWSFDKANKRLVLSGAPTKAGVYTAVFRASTGMKTGLTVAATVVVLDPVVIGGGIDGSLPLNASVAKTRTFADVPVFDTTTNRLAGVFTLTLPRTGRASAKYRSVDSGTFSLSSAAWDSIDAAGTFTAVLTGKTAAGLPSTMTVRALAGGEVEVDFADPAAPTHDFSVLMPGVLWSKSKPATDFKGYYTVSLPVLASVVSGDPLNCGAFGSGYATLKMNTAAAINAGKFTYAGVLPDGRAFSGSAVATPRDWTKLPSGSFWARALVPVVSAGAADSLAGAFQVSPGAWDPTATSMVTDGKCSGRCYYKTIRRSVAPAKEALFFWRHQEKAADACYEVRLDAYGTYYVSTDDFVSCCKTTFQDEPLRFFVQDEGDGDSGNWPTNGAPTVTVTYTKKTQTNAIKVASNKRGLSLSFTPATGIVSGSFSLGGEKMTYKGVVLPGWGSSECTACGYGTDNTGGVEAQLCPFISGAAWFNYNFEYQDEKGKDRTISVRKGCPFSIGTQTAR